MNLVGSHLFSVLKLYYFGFSFISYIIILGWCLWQCLGLHSLPLFKYEYLMFVYFIVCKGRNCEAILYSLQKKLLRFRLQSFFLGKSIYNPQCQNVWRAETSALWCQLLLVWHGVSLSSAYTPDHLFGGNVRSSVVFERERDH